MIRVVAGLLYHPANSRFVLVGERSGFSYHGFWEFPGGKVEGGETDQEALEREWREELGISIAAGDPIATLVFHRPVPAPDPLLSITFPFSITLYAVQYVDTWGILKEDRWKLDSHSRMGWLNLDRTFYYSPQVVFSPEGHGAKYKAQYAFYPYGAAFQTTIIEPVPIAYTPNVVPSMRPFLNMIAAMEQK